MTWESRREAEHQQHLERCRSGSFTDVVAALHEWAAVESVPAQDEFDLILARLEKMSAEVTGLLGDPYKQGVYHVPIASEVREVLGMKGIS
jgi:hypothetical protein